MRINPVFKKELKVSVRGIKLPVILVIFNTILSLISLLYFYTIIENVQWSGSVAYSSSITLYVIMVCIQFGLLVMLVPAITAGSISGERERQTLEVLLSTGFAPKRVIFGKLLSSLSTIILMLVSSMPVISLVFVFGGVSISNILCTVLYLVFVGIYAGAIGIACSTKLKKTTSATVATYGLILLIGLGTILLTVVCVYFQLFQSQYASSNIGPWSLILLMNPGVTFISILTSQVGAMNTFAQYLNEFGTPEFVARHWNILSILVQSVLISLLLLLATRKLKPSNNKK